MLSVWVASVIYISRLSLNCVQPYCIFYKFFHILLSQSRLFTSSFHLSTHSDSRFPLLRHALFFSPTDSFLSPPHFSSLQHSLPSSPPLSLLLTAPLFPPLRSSLPSSPLVFPPHSPLSLRLSSPSSPPLSSSSSASLSSLSPPINSPSSTPRSSIPAAGDQ